MIHVIGHRGACGFELENTISSFTKAYELGADMIEIDVQSTSDNKFVVFHDNILDRLTNTHGYLNKLSLKEIKKINLSNGTKILELEEVCKFCKQKKLGLFIEIKSEGITEEVYKQAIRYLDYQTFILGSFNHNEIKTFQKNKLPANTSIIFESYPLNLKEYILNINCEYVSVGFESVTDSMVKELKETKKKIIFWTLDNATEAKKAIDYRPYGIISNYPNIIKETINTFLPNE